APGGDNYVLDLDGTAFVTWEDITLHRTGNLVEGTVLQLRGAANAVAFQRVHFWGGGQNVASASLIRAEDTEVDGLSIQNSQLQGGSYGLLADASLGNDLPNWTLNQVEFFGQQVGGARLTDLLDFTFSGIEIILTVNGTSLQFVDALGGTLTQSYIQNDQGGTGLHLDDVGTLANPVQFINNRFSVGGNGVDRKGWLITNGSDGLSLLHNSVHIHGDNLATHYAIEIDGVGANNLIENNLFVKSTTGPTAKAAAIADLAGSNFNDYYSTGGNLMEANAVTYADLAAWQLASGGDAQSLSIDPLFASATDLRVAAIPLKQTGNNQGVLTDFEGDARTVATPDLGADEFLPQIYDNLLNTCVTFDPVVSTGSGAWIYLYADRELVAAINDQGNALGTISGEVYVNTAAIRLDSDGNRYLDRNWHISTTNAPASPVSVRLYFLNDELNDLMVVDPLVTGPGDLSITRYSGNNENCDLNDNQPFPGAPYQVYGPGVNVNGDLFGVDYYVQSDVDNFSEFYLNSTGVVLPLEIQHFRAEAVGEGVELNWSLPADVSWQSLEVLRTGATQMQESIATLRPGQYVAGQQSFTFLDEGTLALSGAKLEYQLRVWDQNGFSYLSQVEQVTIEDRQWSMSLAPNPTRSSTNLYLNQVDRFSPVELAVFDLHGRLVWEKQFEMDGAHAKQELPTVTWGKGIFIVKVTIAGNRQVQRLSIQ
ncbi:MAG: T9SS type A sorting domain-containing protein, partial [Bacteroidota bacterium]